MSKLTLTAAGLAALVAGVAIAQSSNPGFFQPAPDGDVALTKIVPPKPPATEVAAAQVERTEIDREAALRAAEEEMDRAERDAAAARASARQATPAPIEGAFSGLTSERDR